jgi:TolB protein
VYHSDADGDFDLYLVDIAERSAPQQLVDAPGSDVEAVWSPDGSRIAFSSNRESDDNYEIYIIDADGGNLQRLTDDPGVDWGPTWSPEGDQIAFATDRDGVRQLFLMDADGSNQKALEPTAETQGWAPSWSPTRNEIVFVSDRDGDSELYLLQMDEGSVTQLTNNELQDERPDWSSDGDHIVYMGAIENTNLFDPEEIFVLPRQGGEPIQLTDNLHGDITPSWSPDGKWIAFSSSRAGGWNIYLLSAQGEGDPIAITQGSAWNRSPAWRP